MPTLRRAKVFALAACLNLALTAPSAAQDRSAALYQHVKNALVAITCEAPRTDSKGSTGFYGTGTLIHPKGIILSSTLVVPPGATKIEVRSTDGRKFDARVVYHDPIIELTLIDIAGDDHPYLSIGKSARLAIADKVYTAGNANRVTSEEGQVALCAGAVSGFYDIVENSDDQSRYRGPVIESTAALNPGIDGGPLLSGRGEVIGLLTLAFKRERKLGTAIPIDVVRASIDALGERASEIGALLGEARGAGLAITKISSGGPAARAGLKVGDRVVAVDGAPLAKAAGWRAALTAAPAGSDITLEVRRGPWEKTLTMKTVTAPSRGYAISWPAPRTIDEDSSDVAEARVFRAALKGVSESVVSVRVERTVTRRGRRNNESPERSASGLVVDSEGHILTSHNAILRATSIVVTLPDGSQHKATVKGTSPTMDLALLKIEARAGLVPARLSKLKVMPSGSSCGVIGRGLGSLTLTTGIISASGRQQGACYQVDAHMNLANAGGALIDRQGRVLGLACFVGENPRWGWGQSSGVGFAVTGDKILEVLEALKEGRSVDATPVLGVRSSNERGLTISAVVDGSAAARAGIKAGDRIVSVNDVVLAGWGDLVRIVRTKLRGDVLKIVVKRGAEFIELQATL